MFDLRFVLGFLVPPIFCLVVANGVVRGKYSSYWLSIAYLFLSRLLAIWAHAYYTIKYILYFSVIDLAIILLSLTLIIKPNYRSMGESLASRLRGYSAMSVSLVAYGFAFFITLAGLSSTLRVTVDGIVGVGIFILGCAYGFATFYFIRRSIRNGSSGKAPVYLFSLLTTLPYFIFLALGGWFMLAWMGAFANPLAFALLVLLPLVIPMLSSLLLNFYTRSLIKNDMVSIR